MAANSYHSINLTSKRYTNGWAIRAHTPTMPALAKRGSVFVSFDARLNCNIIHHLISKDVIKPKADNELELDFKRLQSHLKDAVNIEELKEVFKKPAKPGDMEAKYFIRGGDFSRSNLMQAIVGRIAAATNLNFERVPDEDIINPEGLVQPGKRKKPAEREVKSKSPKAEAPLITGSYLVKLPEEFSSYFTRLCAQETLASKISRKRRKTGEDIAQLEKAYKKIYSLLWDVAVALEENFSGGQLSKAAACEIMLQLEKHLAIYTSKRKLGPQDLDTRLSYLRGQFKKGLG